jgi:hypothetical protein
LDQAVEKKVYGLETITNNAAEEVTDQFPDQIPVADENTILDIID